MSDRISNTTPTVFVLFLRNLAHVIYTVPKNVTAFSAISGTRTVRVFLFSNLAYLVELYRLFYLENLSRPKYHEFSLKLLIFFTNATILEC